ncbi:hypothetical protein [Streptomyces sp. NRRL F-525]|uniref:hypothetical protein n=1 Tax=Streptomyces sp. NRRL F-525 TaxID=1463861 RepID=UPI00131E9A35|nr:hypothetical protein [Streptomyces sp. NRRL F-525]
MGFQLEDTPDSARHVGRLLGRLPDGTIPTERIGAALYEREFNDAAMEPGGTWSGTEPPDVQPAYLVPSCRCGWRGPEMPYDPHAGVWSGGRYHNGQDLDAHRVWKAHATAALVPAVPEGHRERLARFADPLGELADERPRAALTLARQLRELADHLEPLAVAEALAHGVPWETIGADLGQTKQAAHGRYQQRPSADLEDRVQALTGGSVTTLLDAARNRRPGTPPPEHRWTGTAARILDRQVPSDDQS